MTNSSRRHDVYGPRQRNTPLCSCSLFRISQGEMLVRSSQSSAVMFHSKMHEGVASSLSGRVSVPRITVCLAEDKARVPSSRQCGLTVVLGQ